MTPTEIVLGAVAAIFIDFDPSAAERLLAPDYVQHNPAVPTGAAPILGFIPALKDSGIEVATHRVIAEGDLVVLHSTYENAQAFGAPTLVAFDVFRVEDGRVAEHWDNLQAPPAETASGRSMTDGPTEISDPDKTAANKALVEAFARDILMGENPGAITDYIAPGPENYLQHNPMVGDGLAALGAAMKAMAEQGSAMAYTKVHKVVAEGDFVFTMSEGSLGETPTAFFDLFRVADGKIVEHWDVISSIPDEMAHQNGKF
ncbi:MAG: nuclear transport factor 2 family protein [Pseudomonadota bacterium]